MTHPTPELVRATHAERERSAGIAGRISGPRSRHEERKRLVVELEAARKAARRHGDSHTRILLARAQQALADHDAGEPEPAA